MHSANDHPKRPLNSPSPISHRGRMKPKYRMMVADRIIDAQELP